MLEIVETGAAAPKALQDFGPDLRQLPAIAELSGSGDLGNRLSEYLSALEKDPGSIQLLRAVHETGLQLCARHLEESRKAAEINDQTAALEDTCLGFLLASEDNAAVRHLFLRGHDAYRGGRYLTAHDDFRLCGMLSDGRQWLRRAVSDYLDRSIPSAIAAATPLLPPPVAAGYRAAYDSLGQARWGPALRALERCVSGLRPAGQDPLPAYRDCLAAAGRVRDRLRLDPVAGPGGGKDAESLENFLVVHDRDRGTERWAGVAGALRQVYSNTELDGGLERAGKALRDGDQRLGMHLLRDLFQRAPRDERVLTLLREMRSRWGKTLLERPGVGRGPMLAARAAGGGQAGPPKPIPKSSRWWITIESEALYNRGLRFYLQGDLRKAAIQWSKSLAINPAQDKSREALAHVEREIAISHR